MLFTTRSRSYNDNIFLSILFFCCRYCFVHSYRSIIIAIQSYVGMFCAQKGRVENVLHVWIEIGRKNNFLFLFAYSKPCFHEEVFLSRSTGKRKCLWFLVVAEIAKFSRFVNSLSNLPLHRAFNNWLDEHFCVSFSVIGIRLLLRGCVMVNMCGQCWLNDSCGMQMTTFIFIRHFHATFTLKKVVNYMALNWNHSKSDNFHCLSTPDNM